MQRPSAVSVIIPPHPEAPVRDPILDILAPASGALPMLEPAVPDLERRIGHALDEIGCAYDSICAMPVSNGSALVARLSPDAIRFISLRPDDIVDRSVSWLLGNDLPDMLAERYAAALDASLGTERCRALANDLWSDIVTANVTASRLELGTLAERLLYTTYSCAYYQLGFHQAQMKELSAIIGLFGSLCAAGNYPVGLLADRTFLVLTR